MFTVVFVIVFTAVFMTVFTAISVNMFMNVFAVVFVHVFTVVFVIVFSAVFMTVFTAVFVTVTWTMSFCISYLAAAVGTVGCAGLVSACSASELGQHTGQMSEHKTIHEHRARSAHRADV